MDSAYKIHRSNFGGSCHEWRSSVRIGYSCDNNRTIVHDKPKDLVETTFGEFGHGCAFLGAHTFHCDFLQLGNVEASVSLAELCVFIPKPMSASILVQVPVVKVRRCRHHS